MLERVRVLSHKSQHKESQNNRDIQAGWKVKLHLCWCRRDNQEDSHSSCVWIVQQQRCRRRCKLSCGECGRVSD